MTAIRVLLLVENNSFPEDFRVRREAHTLRDAGYRVSVIAPRGPGQPRRERLDGIEVHRFAAPPGGRGLTGYAVEFAWATLAIGWLAARVALRDGVDVVHAANPPDTLFAIGAVFRLFGRKFVFDHHDLSPEVYLSRFAKPRENAVSRCLRLMERGSYATANVVIATNESYRRRAIERGGKPADKVFVVRNGPPLAYQPMTPDPALVGAAPHLIGYIGTIGPQDGLDGWMRSLHHLVTVLGRRDVLALVIGDGDALPAVRALAAHLGIERHVRFTGRLSELESRRCLSAVSLCVQPDPAGPLNDLSTMNKLMEYMALGKATVAFDLPETRVSAQGAALYAPAGDEAAFARLVCGLLDDPPERERMGALGARRIATALSWEHSAPWLLRAYREGLGLPATAAPSLDHPL